MTTVLADIAHGQTNWADIFFLVGVIVFAIAAVVRAMAKSIDGTLVAVGLAVVALAWLLL